jgi:tRNA A37 threonylcarbamoyladenosine dehydratase
MNTDFPIETHVSTAQAERFAGIERLYGRGSLDRLAHAHVCVIGVGGVGSWAAEALARSGIGRLTLIDGDDVCLSNTNRQLHALDGQYGKPKVGVVAERAHAISPTIRLEAVIDACDALKVKLETIVWCRRRKVPLVTVGAAGGRTDPTQVRVRDLSRTEHDAMLSMIRKKLRQEYGFPRNPDRFFGVSAVYSLQNVRYPQPDGSVCGVRPPGGDALKLDCGGGLGAATHVTGAFAFAAVGKALEKLTSVRG